MSESGAEQTVTTVVVQPPPTIKVTVTPNITEIDSTPKGQVTLVEVKRGPIGPVGPPGPPGPPGAATSTLTYAQATPSDYWLIEHNLGYQPNVTLTDSAGSAIFCSPHYIDANTIAINLSIPLSGFAYLS